MIDTSEDLDAALVFCLFSVCVSGGSDGHLHRGLGRINWQLFRVVRAEVLRYLRFSRCYTIHILLVFYP
jgi:hypothetical protein